MQKGNKKIEESIVKLLHAHQSTGPTLLKDIQKSDPSVSKETFYRILRTLLSEEVINKHNTIYQLNRHWLQKIYRFSKKHIETNQAGNKDSILAFEEGDRISYKFKNPNLMGIYWAHTYDMIFDQHDKNMPILVYHPHEWLIHTRTESESFFLSRFRDDKKLVFFALGGTTHLDLEFKRTYEHTYIQIGAGINYGLKNTEYINVLGDFIFKVSVSKKFSDEIDLFFKQNTEITPDNGLLLEKICNRKDSAKMTFTRSKKEADVWRAKFKKHFYKPQK